MNLNLKRIFDDKKTLFLQGESGTGKTSLAKELQSTYSPSSSFVYVNLASMGSSLFEDQLFGHKKSAFTGADQDAPGFLSRVGNGVLFLDEIAEIEKESQRKLLSILEEGVYYPLGSTKPEYFRGHVIAASHQDLKALVDKGEFRKDLYYRVCRFQLELRPLREKNEEVEEGLSPYRFKMDEKLYRYLTSEYPWPGNYREMKNFIDYLEYSAEFRRIRLEDVPAWMSLNSDEKASSSLSAHPCLYHQALEEFEKEYLHKAMLYYEGRVNYASEMLKLSKSTLIAKLKKYGINSLQIKAMSQRGNNLAQVA